MIHLLLVTLPIPFFLFRFYRLALGLLTRRPVPGSEYCVRVCFMFVRCMNSRRRYICFCTSAERNRITPHPQTAPSSHATHCTRHTHTYLKARHAPKYAHARSSEDPLPSRIESVHEASEHVVHAERSSCRHDTLRATHPASVRHGHPPVSSVRLALSASQAHNQACHSPPHQPIQHITRPVRGAWPQPFYDFCFFFAGPSKLGSR